MYLRDKGGNINIYSGPAFNCGRYVRLKDGDAGDNDDSDNDNDDDSDDGGGEGGGGDEMEDKDEDKGNNGGGGESEGGPEGEEKVRTETLFYCTVTVVAHRPAAAAAAWISMTSSPNNFLGPAGWRGAQRPI